MILKLTNQEMLNSIGGIGKLMNEDLPIVTSFALSKNINNIQSALEVFESERHRLISRCAIKDENGEIIKEDGNVRIAPENIELWNESMKQLRLIEQDIDISTINLSDISHVKISVAELRAIEFMIVQE